MLVVSLKYTPVTQSILCLIFPIYISIIQRLNYGGQESKKLFAVYNFDIILKQGQGRQTWYELVDPPSLPPPPKKKEKKKIKSRVSVREKANDKVLSVLFLECMRK